MTTGVVLWPLSESGKLLEHADIATDLDTPSCNVIVMIQLAAAVKYVVKLDFTSTS